MRCKDSGSTGFDFFGFVAACTDYRGLIRGFQKYPAGLDFVIFESFVWDRKGLQGFGWIFLWSVTFGVNVKALMGCCLVGKEMFGRGCSGHCIYSGVDVIILQR